MDRANLSTHLVGVLVVASLVVKRQLEKRKRPWRIWLWDIGKQLAGQMVIHLLNLVVSHTTSRHTDNARSNHLVLIIHVDLGSNSSSGQ